MAPDALHAGSLTFRVHNVLVGLEEGDEVLARVRDRLARGEPLNASDRVDLILLPLMHQTRPLEEVVREAITATEALPKAERAETVGAMVGLAYTYLDERVAVALLEALKMTNVLQEWLAQGIEQGIEQGRVEGERESLRRVVRTRFGMVPPALEERIAQAEDEALGELLDRAAVATAVTEI